jgi:replicative DNA helicase
MSDFQTSREAEVSVLATLLVEPSGFSRVITIVKPEDFFYPDTKKLFLTMQALFSRGIEINIQTVLNYFKVENYNSITDLDLREFLDYRVSLETAISFSSQIAEFSGWRLLKLGLERVSKEVNEHPTSLSDVSQSLSTLVSNITSKGLRDDILHGSSLIEEYIGMLNRPKGLYVFSGIKEIDDNIFDFNPKELSYVAARPGYGKTTWMLQSAIRNVQKGNRVGFLSMEMERPKIINRVVSHISEISGTKIVRMTSSDFRSSRKLTSALEEVANYPLFVDDTGPWTSDTVPQKIRKMHYDYGCTIIYVDYIGLIMGSGTLASAQRNQQLSYISAGLKGLSSELGIPILAASQLNRDVERRSEPRPTLADLRDSGSLEQDASIVGFIYPDFSKALDGDKKQSVFGDSLEVPTIFEIAKQRNGPVNQYELIFNKQFGRFVSREEKNATY